LLDAAPASPRNRLVYEHGDLFRLAASYAYALTQNHPFIDRNKRIALTVAGVFLELNGFRLEASEQDAATATRALSTRQLDERGFAEWLRMVSSPLRRQKNSTTGKIKKKK
jgi:death-on-curing protein